MKLASTILMAAATALAYTHNVDERSFEGPVLEIRDNWTKGGCYSSAGSLTLNGTDTYQSLGACSLVADGNNANVIAMTNGDTCYYGSSLPDDSDKVDDSKCNQACQGWPQDNCGAKGFYRVYTNGVVSGSGSGSSSDPDDTPSSVPAAAVVASTPTTTAVSVITTGATGATVLVTIPGASVAAATVSVTPTSTPSVSSSASGGSSDNGGGSKTAAIAAGVVVGIVGAVAIATGIFFWLRSRRHREQAAELQRQNSITGLRSEKPPSTYSMPDSRLEPAYMRRVSDGSIADNQDYSRRILKVTNPDGR